MIVVRTDASATIGVGHAMRCLALAEAWIDGGGDVTFAMAEVPPAVAARIARSGARVAMIRDVADVVAIVRDARARYVVVDGYHLGAAYQDALARSGARLVVIDDRGETATPAAAIVLNHNPYATRAMYDHLDGAAWLLVGRDYTLLRKQFRAAGAHRAVAERARHVLVSFGGADTANLTTRALAALADVDGLEVVVITGAANARAAELRAPAGAAATFRVIADVDDMAAEMRAADVAIVAAGTTCWELAACGVPAIAVVVADNQRDVAASIGELGLGVPLALEEATAIGLRRAFDVLSGDVARRAAMAQHGPEVIDGRGAVRVCAALRGSEDAA